MKTCSKCGVEKEPTEFYPRKGGKFGVRADCKECVIGRSVAWGKTHLVKRRAQSAKWKAENPDRSRAMVDAWRAAHPEQAAKNRAEWAAANPKKIREAVDKWQAKNPGKVREVSMRRRATKFKATPVWADYDLIDATYTMAVAITKLTGIKHHVDHIVPLRHPLVQGLHVGCNLQILPAVENHKKGNRHWPDMPGSEIAGASCR